MTGPDDPALRPAAGRRWRCAASLSRRVLEVDHSVADVLDRPTESTSCRSAVVIGLDRRSGLGGRSRRLAADVTGARADAVLVVVVDEARCNTVVVALARDLGVQLAGIGVERLGAAYEYGGTAMVVQAVRGLLDVPIHHVIGVDFQAFARSIDVLGGIEVDLEFERFDHRTGLRTERGRHTMGGQQALAFVRSRHQDPEDFARRSGRRRGRGGRAASRERPLPLSAQLDDAQRRGALTEVLTAVRQKLDHRPGAWTAARLAMATRRHVVVDPTVVDPAILAGLVTAASWPATFVELPVRATRPPSALCSPFPPFQRHSARLLEPAGADAAALADRLRDQLR